MKLKYLFQGMLLMTCSLSTGVFFSLTGEIHLSFIAAFFVGTFGFVGLIEDKNIGED